MVSALWHESALSEDQGSMKLTWRWPPRVALTSFPGKKNEKPLSPAGYLVRLALRVNNADQQQDILDLV